VRSENEPRLLLARVGGVFPHGDNISIMSVVSKPAFNTDASYVPDVSDTTKWEERRKYRIAIFVVETLPTKSRYFYPNDPRNNTFKMNAHVCWFFFLIYREFSP